MGADSLDFAELAGATNALTTSKAASTYNRMKNN